MLMIYVNFNFLDLMQKLLENAFKNNIEESVVRSSLENGEK